MLITEKIAEFTETFQNYNQFQALCINKLDNNLWE